MLKRIGYFLLTNLAVMVLFSIILVIAQYFGLDLTGNSFNAILASALIFGMVGSFFSLLMSRWSAKKLMGVQLVDETDQGIYQEYYQSVKRLAQKASLPMPEVGVYDGHEINAFATGYSKSASLVAISSGLMNYYRQGKVKEIEAIIGHELSHIKNGDMVTLALIQGVVNAFVIVLSRVIINAIKNANQNMGALLENVIYIGLQIVFGILATPIVMYFSRQREYRADLGGASLTSREDMINALKSIHSNELPKEIEAFGFSGSKESIFSSHPSLEKRIANLQKYAKSSIVS